MEEEIVKKAVALLHACMIRERTGNPWHDHGIGYLLFAMEEKSLFRSITDEAHILCRIARAVPILDGNPMKKEVDMRKKDPRKMALQIAGLRTNETHLPENERVFEDPYAEYFFPEEVRKMARNTDWVKAEGAKYEAIMPGVNGALVARIRFIFQTAWIQDGKKDHPLHNARKDISVPQAGSAASRPCSNSYMRPPERQTLRRSRQACTEI